MSFIYKDVLLQFMGQYLFIFPGHDSHTFLICAILRKAYVSKSLTGTHTWRKTLSLKKKYCHGQDVPTEEIKSFTDLILHFRHPLHAGRKVSLFLMFQCVATSHSYIYSFKKHNGEQYS